MRRSLRICAVVLGGPLLLLGPSRATAQDVDPNLWGVDGRVFAIARSGNTVYIAGDFGRVGPNSGGGVPVSRSDGAPLRPYARVVGRVFAAIPDGDGGWYIGGRFDGVGGLPRSNLAHLLADGSVAAWNPGTDGVVEAMARKGQTIYVGGCFTNIGGRPRNNLAAVDAVTGTVTDWDPNVLGVRFFGGVDVYTLDVQGHTVYVGGVFTVIGGKQRNGLAAVDARTGLATDWAPEAELGAWVNTLAVSGDVVYVGGPFRTLGGQPRKLIAALDLKTGRATAFDAHASGTWPNEYFPFPNVYTLAVRGNTLYVGGNFDHMGGQPRNNIAALDARTGAALDWNAHLEGGYYAYVYSLAIRDNVVYAGGGFSGIGGRKQSWIAALDAKTGLATDWNPRPNSSVLKVAASDNSVYLGGYFTSVWDWQPRRNIAALDATTGAVKPWDPNPDGTLIQALAISGGTVFAGGNFSNIGGQARRGIAALDTLTGAATDWDAHASAPIGAIVVSGRTLYVGWGASMIGGKTRTGAAALDTETAQVTAFDPETDGPVYAIAVKDSTVYLGGFFERVGGKPRRFVAAVNATTGAVTPWNPGVSSFINALAVIGTTVYVGGAYFEIGGQPRNSLAAVDAKTAAVLPWNADPSPGSRVAAYVYALAAIGNTLYVGGDFSAIGGQPRRNLAAIDVVTGSALSWDPQPDGLVWSLAVTDNLVYVGGGFTRMGLSPCSGLAAISPAGTRAILKTVTPIVSTSVAQELKLSVPNPAGSWAPVRFTLPWVAPVSLAVFDLQGRRVAKLLDQDLLPAGAHEVALPAANWPAGVYFCRLEARGAVITRKLVLAR